MRNESDRKGTEREGEGEKRRGAKRGRRRGLYVVR